MCSEGTGCTKCVITESERERPLDMLIPSVSVRFKKEHPDAKAPEYTTEHAAGADLSSVEDIVIAPGSRQLISTGLSVEIPVGYELQVRPRSGLAYKNGITVLNTPGTVDSDYRGTVKVILCNTSADPFTVTKGMRIAQAVIAPVVRGQYEIADDLTDTARGTGGFGHTGN